MGDFCAAFVHYHLRGGGVTRMIETARRCLAARDIPVAVVTGEPPTAGEPPPHVRVVDDLSYGRRADVSFVLNEVKAAARDALGRDPDLWHFHNHCLGKNIVVPELASLLAGEGRTVLLQVHDFAEDGRPGLYRQLLDDLGGGDPAVLGRILYPAGPGVHYCTINSRDAGFLLGAGADAGTVHYLPNCANDAAGIQPGDDVTGDRRLLLYPTRAIRRKNLGEFLLWSAAAGEDDVFGVTLAPRNPLQQRIYRKWVAFAERLGLPVMFELGAGVPFEDVIGSAAAVMTTSITEGFGLAYLEPWLLDRPLAGRDLPEITADLKEAGLNLSGLYDRLEVPLDWVGEDRFAKTVRIEFERYMEAYGCRAEPADVEAAVKIAVDDDFIDVGRLNESMQEDVIAAVAAKPALRDRIRPARPDDGVADQETIAANRAVVEQSFNAASYGARLREIYEAVLSSAGGACGALDGSAILGAFTRPERFCLLRSVR